MHRFIQFNDEKIDSFQFMQMTDLVKTLTRQEPFEVKYGPHSYLDHINRTVFVSHFWDHRKTEDERAGLKSDIYLRAIGSFNYTDFSVVKKFLKKNKSSKISSFAKQLFMILEDIRLEELCKKERRGTTGAFLVRRSIFRKYFQDQLQVNLVKGITTDAFYNRIFLTLTAQSPLEKYASINEELDLAMPYVDRRLQSVYDASNTEAIASICLDIIAVVEELLTKDMLNEYFHLPESIFTLNSSAEERFEELKRKDPLANCDIQEEEKSGNEEVINEEYRTWHRETEDKGESFLQFDLDRGSESDILGEGVREGDDADQALAMVQGSSKQSNRNQYDNLDAAEKEREEQEGGKGADYGKENRFAIPYFLEPHPPTYEEINQYETFQSSILLYQKKLQKMIEKTLEHKKILPRNDLHVGRLNKKLLRFFTDENPRVFYKKQEPSHEIDAVFTLLMDCSASMYDKMEQTKLGVTLFHESLKSLKVPHEVVGFWEDTNEATVENQPNYFKTVIDFRKSLQRTSGPEITQLQPEEDNRDGLAIRVMTKRLLKRSEKQRFLLVFSDGEPAAMGYEKNGIIDTHEAVSDARKRGIEVINVFLANSEIDEGQRKTIQNIYGSYSILVSNIDELPDVLFPLLRRLLYKSI